MSAPLLVSRHRRHRFLGARAAFVGKPRAPIVADGSVAGRCSGPPFAATAGAQRTPTCPGNRGGGAGSGAGGLHRRRSRPGRAALGVRLHPWRPRHHRLHVRDPGQRTAQRSRPPASTTRCTTPPPATGPSARARWRRRPRSAPTTPASRRACWKRWRNWPPAPMRCCWSAYDGQRHGAGGAGLAQPGIAGRRAAAGSRPGAGDAAIAGAAWKSKPTPAPHGPLSLLLAAATRWRRCCRCSRRWRCGETRATACGDRQRQRAADRHRP